MLRKTLLALVAFLVIGFMFSQPVSAGFFKKFKSSKKHVKEQEVKENRQKKALIVEIFASWCPGCKNIEPTLELLIKDNPDIEFVKLDVSTPSKAKASEEQAEKLKIIDFYNANKSKTATVAVFVPSTLELVSVFQNNSDIEEYKHALKESEDKEHALRQPPT